VQFFVKKIRFGFSQHSPSLRVDVVGVLRNRLSVRLGNAFKVLLDAPLFQHFFVVNKVLQVIRVTVFDALAKQQDGLADKNAPLFERFPLVNEKKSAKKRLNFMGNNPSTVLGRDDEKPFPYILPVPGMIQFQREISGNGRVVSPHRFLDAACDFVKVVTVFCDDLIHCDLRFYGFKLKYD